MTDYSKIEIAKNIIEELLQRCGIANITVSYEESVTKGLVFNITCAEDAYLLIGKQGSTLHALQILCAQLIERRLKEPLQFTLDVDDYKLKREWVLKQTVKAAVEHVKKTGRAAALEPMPNFDRRFVHTYLQKNFSEAESVSIGREPYRKVVIRLKR